MTASYWLDEPYDPRPDLDGDVTADVCVIGGGVAGLATTWHLLDRGFRPVLVEACEVAAGASGRNGGFFIAGAAPMYHDTVREWGRDRARRIHRASLEAQAEMLEVAEAIGAARHFGHDGMLRLAVDEKEAADVRAHQAALAADGFPGELVDTEGLPEALRRPGRAGVFFPGDCAVHPVRWLRALADACERRGARLFERTRVRHGGQGVVAGRGRVLADAVVMAGDAAIGRVAPAVRPRRLHMVATRPEPTRRLPCPVYSRYGHEYAQQRPDGAVTLGGYSDLDGDSGWTERDEVSDRVVRRLERHLRDELGVRAAVSHRWVGVVGYSADALPRCGFVPAREDLLALGGYNGTGHVQAWVAARIVADLLAHGTSADADLYAPIAATPARP